MVSFENMLKSDLVSAPYAKPSCILLIVAIQSQLILLVAPVAGHVASVGLNYYVTSYSDQANMKKEKSQRYLRYRKYYCLKS